MNMFDNYFSEIVPDNLQAYAQQVIAKLESCLDDKQLDRLNSIVASDASLREQLIKALIGSEYILASCLADPNLLFHHLLSDAPFSPITPVKIVDAIETACSDDLSLDEFNSLLRLLRRRFMTALYWRDLNNLADFNEVSAAMTALAEVFVQQALDFNYRLLVEKHGYPIGGESGQIQPMLIIGMGKLGGEELNVSSDIDLIFAFPESGKTEKINSDNVLPIKSIENQQFFIFLGQKLIKSLNEATQQGFVFRVDMRLRPYGDSGSLVSNFAALENYYETQGRDWERFASVKARVIACSTIIDASLNTVALNKQRLFERGSIDDFYAILKPFVYRKYIDFTMVESLRKLKAMIVQEVRRKKLQGNVKLGRGGIREVEFIVQSFQLVRGGREQELQGRNLLSVLNYLGNCHYLSEKTVKRLEDAYLFLRKVEHSLQAVSDSQTQCLPVDKVACDNLAWLSGFSDWNSFLECLDKHRDAVAKEFARVFADKETEQENSNNDSTWGLLWNFLRESSPSNTSAALINASSSRDGYGEVFEWARTHCDEGTGIHEDVLYALVDRLILFKSNRRVIGLSESAQKKLDTLMPTLLTVLLSCDKEQANSQLNNEQVMELIARVVNWLESIVMRTSYLSLLIENPQIIKHLVTLFRASSWVVDTLTQIPALLDELLNPEALYSLPEKTALRDELRQQLLRLEPDDLEAQMEVLRYFKLAHYLHVAACEITGSLPLMKVSDYLTLIAEVILEQVLSFSWQGLVARHGCPEGTAQNKTGFLVVGYGKLGGIEMSYSSDLDLVFIYDASTDGETNGPRPLDHQTFYTRLGQKMIHMMNTRSMSGQLYEIDMRLRPSGNSGMLVTSIGAFERYQKQEAWVWEHQALVRARAVAGDNVLAARFDEVRREILCQSRERNELKAAVVDMREKMRQHLVGTSKTNNNNGKNSAEMDEFHLKQSTGGIVDIEFMVQYAVLAWSAKKPELCRWTDNIRLLESLHNLGLLDAEQSQRLIDIYQLYRLQGHRLALQQNQSSVIGAAPFTKEREQIRHLWNYFFDGDSGDK